MSEGFSGKLRVEAGQAWEAIVKHRFTDELAAGTISAPAMKKYLIQDYRFLDAFVVLLGATIAHARTLQDRIPGCQFIALITGRENTYFHRSFESLGVSAEELESTPDDPAMTGFQNLMLSAARSGELSEMLAVLVVAEWSYMSWADRVLPTAVAEPFWSREWVDLHTSSALGSVVDWLRGLLDKEEPHLSEEQAQVV
eukprot:gene28287-31395_t